MRKPSSSMSTQKRVTRYASDNELQQKDKSIASISRSMFWACRRSPKESEWNCEASDLSNSVVTCNQWNSIPGVKVQPEGTTLSVKVPVLINTKTIPKGTEVVVRGKVPAPKVAPVKKRRTWEDDARQEYASSKVMRVKQGSVHDNGLERQG